jgi:uncharacterized protein YegP (UPF0339 family)
VFFLGHLGMVANVDWLARWCYPFCMARGGKKITDARDFQLTGDARTGYTYFVTGSSDDGYRWALVDRRGGTLCSSDVFARKAECLTALRAVQRHAATTHVIDEAGQTCRSGGLRGAERVLSRRPRVGPGA